MVAQLLTEIRDEATNFLSEFLKINTTNPPGNETAAAKFVANYLKKAGLECEVLESAPGRGSVITRIKGKAKAPSLLLLSHLDVVPAIEKEWTVPPFSGTVKDGYVWGRGAIDCKSLVVDEALVMKLLKKENLVPEGDIIFAATADEEKGGKYGVEWLVNNCAHKIKTDYVINEGAGYSYPAKSKHVFTVQTAEKGVNWLRIKSKGRPGHGSIPGAADNAVLRMAKVVETLGTYRSKIRVVPTVKLMIQGLAKHQSIPSQLSSSLLANPQLADKILDNMAKKDSASAEFFRATLRNTIAPTIIKGGIKENIIPSECEAAFDCRILPGETSESLLREMKRVLSAAEIEMDKLEFEFTQTGEPSESDMNSPLYTTIRETLQKLEPRSEVVPFMTTGGTDSRFLRRLGSICYGFRPVKTDMPLDTFLRLTHGIDERISIDNLVFGTSALYELAKEFSFGAER
jgi:acetylornithine deacetylase/succinyl-diaminopimelate desuccinylase-like protein